MANLNWDRNKSNLRFKGEEFQIKKKKVFTIPSELNLEIEGALEKYLGSPEWTELLSLRSFYERLGYYTPKQKKYLGDLLKRVRSLPTRPR